MEELREIHSEGNTIIMVTHNPALTAYATRVINMLDGQIDTDVKTVEDKDLPQPIEIHFRQRNVLKEVKDALTGKKDAETEKEEKAVEEIEKEEAEKEEVKREEIEKETDEGEEE